MIKSLQFILNNLSLSQDTSHFILNPQAINNNTNVNGIAIDSRKVENDFLFVAISGYKSDGHIYIDSAYKNGASCIAIDQQHVNDIKDEIKNNLPIIVFEDTRKAIAILSKIFYDNPSQKLKLVGVTGTNGKTTITYMLKNIFQTAGHKVGVIGTICNYIGDKKIENNITTPDSLDLNSLFHQMIQEQVTHVFMEVSSHALYLDRVLGLNFDCVIFTNLSEDHLDFHKNMEDYLLTKMKILNILSQSDKKSTLAILNSDLDFSKDLISKSQSLNLNYVTFGIHNDSTYKGTNIEYSLSHSRFTIQNGSFHSKLKIPLPGRFNIYNTLCSFAAAIFLGIPNDAIQTGMDKVSVPGRFQIIPTPNEAYVVVDYAHTDDALINVLSTIRALNPNRIISVFGCGGDRDKGKRPLMGAVSGKMSDITIITSDNPRTEDPQQILKGIIQGVEQTTGKYLSIESRYSAINEAIQLSEKGDVILIAGKGHENYQILKDRTIHFDDKETVQEIILQIQNKS